MREILNVYVAVLGRLEKTDIILRKWYYHHLHDDVADFISHRQYDCGHRCYRTIEKCEVAIRETIVDDEEIFKLVTIKL